MPPVVGITGGYEKTPNGVERVYLASEYFDAIEIAGGIPLLLPPVHDGQFLRDQLARIDALLIPGGADFSPSRYGQPPQPSAKLVHPRRETYDFHCVATALEMDLPILGICYGMQVLNVALGGTLIQDLPPAVAEGVVHRPAEGRSSHSITVDPRTRLHAIIGSSRIEVNSSHHQAIDRLGKGLRVSARSEDGVIEAIEGLGDRFLVGVQWHPESLIDRPEQLALFQALLGATRKSC